MVVAPVGVHERGSTAGPATPPPDRWNAPEQRHEPGDVVAVAAGQTEREGDAVPVGDDVVLGARLAAVDRARTRFGPPFSART